MFQPHCPLGAWVGLLVSLTLATSATGKMLDLTHLLNNRSQHYQLFRDFEIHAVMKGFQSQLNGLWVEANDLTLNEHTGTHVDAPAHVWQHGIHMHEIPMADLIGPAVVISVTEKSKTNRDYLLTKQDVLDFEEKHGQIPERAIVLLETGGAQLYWIPSQYLGTEAIEDKGSVHFPGFGSSVLDWLIEVRKINGIGTDRYSFDAGQNNGLPAHISLLSHGKFGIENMNNLLRMPPVGATLIVGALPIEGGSGSPARVLAFWDTDIPVFASASGFYPRVCGLVFGFVVAVFY